MYSITEMNRNKRDILSDLERMRPNGQSDNIPTRVGFHYVTKCFVEKTVGSLEFEYSSKSSRVDIVDSA